MRILIVGNGGREHALAWKAAQSPQAEMIWVAPGNAGTALEPKVKNISISATDVQTLLQFATREKIDLTIIGPEAPLASGIVDAFTKAKLPCFGPTKNAAQLESSKAYCKNFLQRHHIPTAAYATFESIKPALEYIKKKSYPLVIKADGLAAGKGVIIADTESQAQQALHDFLQEGQLGAAGARVVIEEFIQGYELSFIVMCDGKHVLTLPTSQDHKRLYDQNQGPNTGGMGAFSPTTCSSALEKTIQKTIIEPTIAGMAQEGIPYTGFLYAGLMITPSGQPKVLEFNCRLGDPEAQVLLMRLKSDLITLCLAATQGKLQNIKADWETRSALGVVMAAQGYPTHASKGVVINGLNAIENHSCKVFHSGTLLEDNHVLTNGGRILTVTALGDDLKSARELAYRNVKNISWDHYHYRSDIGAEVSMIPR